MTKGKSKEQLTYIYSKKILEHNLQGLEDIQIPQASRYSAMKVVIR